MISDLTVFHVGALDVIDPAELVGQHGVLLVGPPERVVEVPAPEVTGVSYDHPSTWSQFGGGP